MKDNTTTYKEIFRLFSSENDYILDKIDSEDFSIFGLSSSGTLVDLSDRKNITYKKMSANQPTKRLRIVSNKMPDTPRKKIKTKRLY
jgi:hypothetical protein